MSTAKIRFDPWISWFWNVCSSLITSLSLLMPCCLFHARLHSLIKQKASDSMAALTSPATTLASKNSSSVGLQLLKLWRTPSLARLPTLLLSLNSSLERLLECVCFEKLSVSSLTSPAAKPTMFCACSCQGLCRSLPLVRSAQGWLQMRLRCTVLHSHASQTKGRGDCAHMWLFKKKKRERRKYVLGLVLLWFPVKRLQKASKLYVNEEHMFWMSDMLSCSLFFRSGTTWTDCSRAGAHSCAL